MVRRLREWLSTSPVPKLFVNAEPGVDPGRGAARVLPRWPNQQEVTVSGNHFLQEDSPDEIGQALAAFVQRS